MAPSRADDARMREWLARLERLSSSPAAAPGGAQRHGPRRPRQLRDLRVPTLILHRTGDRLIDVRHSRCVAERIPGARLVELPGVDSLPRVGDTEALLGEIEEFLTGGRTARRSAGC